MKKIFLLLLSILIHLLDICKALVQCNGTVTKTQLCSIEVGYNLGNSGSHKLGAPVPLSSIINVLDVADFDENESKITLNLLLTIGWPDHRIKLESNNPTEYDTYILYFY